MADVIDASRDAAIVVDFWAPWCGPCKQLGPMLEKSVRDARGKVRMVKINVDENQELAAQMRIQSIPAVYAFRDGRPVDAFVGAVTESQVKQFVGKLAAAGGGAPDPVAEAVELAKEAVAAGDHALAANIFAQVLQHEPGNIDAIAGMAHIHIQRKEFAKAKDLLSRVPPDQAGHADIVTAKAALELAEAGNQAAGKLDELKAQVKREPDNHQAGLDLATALFAAGEREAAIDGLLDLIKRDRVWNEEAARKQLLKFLEAMGFTDPLSVAARRRLSTILFS
jgi:putative thioredoxin